MPLLDKQLVSENINAKVINASIGDTTSGGRSRSPGPAGAAQAKRRGDELGGNDALRGLPLDMTEKT